MLQLEHAEQILLDLDQHALLESRRLYGRHSVMILTMLARDSLAASR